MDHGRKEAMETMWPPVGGASQRPAIITQGLCGSFSLSPALPGSGCPLSLPRLPGPLPTPNPHSWLPGSGIWGHPSCSVFLSFLPQGEESGLRHKRGLLQGHRGQAW